jgi:hypothetical protein
MNAEMLIQISPLRSPLKCRHVVVGTRFCASAARPNAGNAVLEQRPLPILPTAFHGDPAKTSTPERLRSPGFSRIRRSRQSALPWQASDRLKPEFQDGIAGLFAQPSSTIHSRSVRSG